MRYKRFGPLIGLIICLSFLIPAMPVAAQSGGDVSFRQQRQVEERVRQERLLRQLSGIRLHEDSASRNAHLAGGVDRLTPEEALPGGYLSQYFR